MPVQNPFPLQIVTKVNSPELLAFLQQFGYDKYADAVDINKIVQALQFIYENLGGAAISDTNKFIVRPIITVTGFAISWQANTQWMINGVIYTHPAADLLTLPPASTDKFRIDLLVVGTDGFYRRIAGIESTGNPASPSLPLNTLLVSIISVNDNTASEIPIGQFISTLDQKEYIITNEMSVGDDVIPFYTPNGSTYRIQGLGGVLSSTYKQSGAPFQGQEITISNETEADLLFKHLVSANSSLIPFYFPNQSDYNCTTNECLKFKYINGYWQFVGAINTGGGGSTPDATESTKGKAQLATNAETLAGTNDSKIVTPLKLKVVTDSLVVDFDDKLDDKEDSIGYVPENTANKSTSTADSASNIKFPVWSAIVSYFSTSRIKTILGQASSTIDGWLSSTDWNTFNNKQNAISGKSLSTNDFSDIDKAKLDSLSNYTGFRTAQSSLANVAAAAGTGTLGDWAIITNPSGNAYFAIWDTDVNAWIEAGQSPTIPGTNLAYTVSGNTLTITSDTGNDVSIPLATASATGLMSKEDKSKLDAIASGATNFTVANVLATVLSGLSLATGGAIVSTDSVLISFGKIQKQINDALSTISGLMVKTANGSDINNIATFRANLGVDKITSTGNSNYTIVSTDKAVVTSATLTTSRTWTLPLANAVNAGYEIIVADLFGGVTSTNTLIISRAGTDTINGATSATIGAQYGMRRLISDGVSKWTFDAGVMRISDFGNIINGLNSKATPIASDAFVIRNSVTQLAEKVTYTDLSATLKAYFDTVYAGTGNTFKRILNNTVETSTVSGTTTETLLYSAPVIAGGTFSNNDYFNFQTTFRKQTGNTIAVTYRVYVSNTNNFATASLLATWITARFNTVLERRNLYFKADGTLTSSIPPTTSLQSDLTNTDAVLTALSVNSANDIYLFVSVQFASAGDNVKMTAIKIYN